MRELKSLGVLDKMWCSEMQSRKTNKLKDTIINKQPNCHMLMSRLRRKKDKA